MDPISMYVNPTGVHPQWWNLVEVVTQFWARVEGPVFPRESDDLPEWGVDLVFESLGYLRGLDVAIARGTLRAAVHDTRTGGRLPIRAEAMHRALRRQGDYELPSSEPGIGDCSEVVPYILAARETLSVEGLDDEFDLHEALVRVQVNVEDLVNQFLPTPRPPDRDTLEWMFTDEGRDVYKAMVDLAHMTPKARSDMELLLRLTRELEEEELREQGDDRYRHERQARDWLRKATMMELVDWCYEHIWDYRAQLVAQSSGGRMSKRKIVLDFFDQWIRRTLVDAGRYVSVDGEKVRDLETDRTSFYKRFCSRVRDDQREW